MCVTAVTSPTPSSSDMSGYSGYSGYSGCSGYGGHLPHALELRHERLRLAFLGFHVLRRLLRLELRRPQPHQRVVTPLLHRRRLCWDAVGHALPQLRQLELEGLRLLPGGLLIA